MDDHETGRAFTVRVGLLPAALLACVCGCRSTGTGSGRSTAGSGDQTPAAELPEAVRAIAEGAEVKPFTRWSVPGVRLYCLSFVVPDNSTDRVVGVEDATGKLLAGADLLRRGGTAAPEELARRVYGVLLGEAFREPLRPDEERSQFASEREWSLVQPPRVEEGTLIFFSMEGDMSPDLVEHRVELATFALTTRSARQLLLDRGETVVLSGPVCIPFASCGCWSGCERAERIARPGRDVAAARLLDGARAGTIVEMRHECLGERCFAVCAADLLPATCEDPYLIVDEPCTESCPPSEAPFHCEGDGEGCRRVEHPTRAAAANGPPSPAGLRYGKYFTAEGAPDPLACSLDAECTTDMLLDANGCCPADPPALLPVTKAYSAWAVAHRSSAACSATACPPPLPPSIPQCPPEPPPECCFRNSCEGGWAADKCPCCDFHVRCIDGWCRNACTRDWQAQVPAAPAPST